MLVYQRVPIFTRTYCCPNQFPQQFHQPLWGAEVTGWTLASHPHPGIDVNR